MARENRSNFGSVTWDFTLWRIEGEASSESGGGQRDLFVVTSEAIEELPVLPDPHIALEWLSANGEHFYRIDKVTRLGELVLPAPSILDDLHDQSGGATFETAIRDTVHMLDGRPAVRGYLMPPELRAAAMVARLTEKSGETPTEGDAAGPCTAECCTAESCLSRVDACPPEREIAELFDRVTDPFFLVDEQTQQRTIYMAVPGGPHSETVRSKSIIHFLNLAEETAALLPVRELNRMIRIMQNWKRAEGKAPR